MENRCRDDVCEERGGLILFGGSKFPPSLKSMGKKGKMPKKARKFRVSNKQENPTYIAFKGHLKLVLEGVFRGFLKITLENENNL